MASHARIATVAFVVLLGAGCAEKTLIRSTPPGARVWINDTLIGMTPVEYRCTRDEFARRQHFRLELDGYLPTEGELRHSVRAGRIVAADLTLGVSLIFKRPTGLRDEYDFPLVPRSLALPTGGTDMPPAH